MSDQNYFSIKSDLSWKDIAENMKTNDHLHQMVENQEMEDHHRELAQMAQAREHGQLALDIYQTPADLIVEAPIAGVAPEDLDISIHDDVLTIHGSRKRSKSIKAKDLIYQECHWGEFSRSIVLPMDVVAERIDAVLEEGILTIKLPKAKSSRSIKVKSK